MPTDNSDVVLPGGERVDSQLFDDLESGLKSDDPESFMEDRLTRQSSEEMPSPFTSRPGTTLKNVAGRRHQERSKQARSTDESFNAPIAPDYNTWVEQPDRYDMPGVDTIPEEEMARRGTSFLDRAQELGAVERVERTTLPGSKKGSFNADPKNRGNPLTGELGYETTVKANEDLDNARFPAFGEGSVLAHETGHAVDFAAGGDGREFLSKRGFFLRNEGDLFGEAQKLSKRVRGGYDASNASYREDNRELIADSLAAVALEPRAARREAPNLVSALEDDIERRVGDSESVFNF